MSYERFKHPRNEYHYAWIVAPVELLDVPIPDGARNADVLDEDGNVVRRKVVSEYLAMPPTISNDGTLALCILCEALEPRIFGVTTADLDFWDLHLPAFGITLNDWLEFEQIDDLLLTENWIQPEEVL